MIERPSLKPESIPPRAQEYGRGNWRKPKGIALVRVANGHVPKAELHWYEAHGIGKRELKRKRYLD